MAEVRFEQATGSTRATHAPAVDALDLEIGDGELMVLVGPSGIGQVDGAADARRAWRRSTAARSGSASATSPMSRRRSATWRWSSRTTRSTRTSTWRRTSPSRCGWRRCGKAERDAARAEAPSCWTSTDLPGSQAGAALGRPAPAGGDGPGDRPRAGGLPHGRAAVEPRRQAARADARGDRGAAGAARRDHGLRDPRPGRGDDARATAWPCCATAAAAVRHAAAALRPPGQRLRRRLHRLAGDEPLHARRGRRARGARRPRARAARRRQRRARGRRRRCGPSRSSSPTTACPGASRSSRSSAPTRTRSAWRQLPTARCASWRAPTPATPGQRRPCGPASRASTRRTCSTAVSGARLGR